MNPDGSVDVYFGPKAPVGMENNRVQTIPGKGWFMILRSYGPRSRGSTRPGGRETSRWYLSMSAHLLFLEHQLVWAAVSVLVFTA